MAQFSQFLFAKSTDTGHRILAASNKQLLPALMSNCCRHYQAPVIFIKF